MVCRVKMPLHGILIIEKYFLFLPKIKSCYEEKVLG